MTDKIKDCFEQGIERKNTNCEKWDAPFIKEGVVPMWVADMDFEIAPAITKRLVRAAEKGAFGYQFLSNRYYDAVIRFMKEKHEYTVERDWICYVPNVVQGLFFGLQSVTDEGDEVIIQSPVYGPFFKVIRDSGRVLVNSPLKNEDGYYTMDFEDLERKITKKTKALLLCNPHNPSGRVWTAEELRKLVSVCAEHDICIISDDIHSDIVTRGHKHTMAASVCREMGVRCITCTSPSKPFNLASVHVANCIIEDEEIREKFKRLLAVHHVNNCNAFAEDALIGAYEESEDWLERMNEYVEDNLDYFVDYIHKYIPALKVYKPEGTYLVWVDFSGTDAMGGNIKEYLSENCHVYVNDGEFFGQEGQGYVRFNLACPRKNVEFALKNLREHF